MARTKANADEYRARISDDSGTIRGKIPSPLVRAMGARPGDTMVFRKGKRGQATMSLERERRSSKESGSRSRAKRA